MPTTRPRHMVTETDRLAQAMDAAAELWPEIAADRGALLRKILQQGMDSVENERTARVEARRTAVRRSAGALTGLWPDGGRDQLRDEWPA